MRNSSEGLNIYEKYFVYYLSNVEQLKCVLATEIA